MVEGKNEPAGVGLPDGWLKEYRPRKNQNGSRIKGDMFYTDPVNGYEFRSLKDVHRYLESGDITHCVMLRNKRKIKDLHSAEDPSLHASCHHTTECINPIQKDASIGKIIQSASIKHTTGEPESDTRKGANVEKKPKEKKQKSKPVKHIATPLRSSLRLAALKNSQETNNVAKDGPATDSTHSNTTDQLQPKQVKPPRRKANSPVLPDTEHGALTLSSPEKVEVNHPAAPNQIQGASANAPVLPQHVGLGETADDIPGSALSSLIRHVWSDPCLQFAFRTLTGDIPILDAGAIAAANYFLPPRNLNKGAIPNCSSSAYDATRSHVQADRVGLSMPRPSDKLYGSSWFPPQ